MSVMVFISKLRQLLWPVWIVAMLSVGVLSPVSLAQGADVPVSQELTYRPVSANETLWKIAISLGHQYPGATVYQIMVALFKKNPDAFKDGDIQRLMSGVRLRLPTVTDVGKSTPEFARVLFDEWSIGKLAPAFYDQNLIEVPPRDTSVNEEKAVEISAPEEARPASISVETTPLTIQQPAESRSPQPTARVAFEVKPDHVEESGWPLWMRWFSVNLTGLAILGLISFFPRVRQPGSSGLSSLSKELLQESAGADAVLMEIAEIKARNTPKNFSRKNENGRSLSIAGWTGGSGSPPWADTGRPSEAELDVFLDMANAYVEIVRLQEAREILGRVIKSGSRHHEFEASQLLKEVESYS